MSRNAICGRCSSKSASACVAVGGLRDDVELRPRFGQLLLQPLAHQRLVFGDQCRRARHRRGAFGERRRRGERQGRVERQDQPRDEIRAASFSSSLERRALAVQQRQPLADVGEADAAARRARRTNPAPVSATVSAMRAPSACASRAAVTSMRPPDGTGSMPCLIAFSTSVISMPGGSAASSSVVRNGDRPREPRAQARLHDAQVRADHRRILPHASSPRRAASASPRAGSG